MKKLVTILASALMLFSTSVFAAGTEKVSAQIKAAFEKDFFKAEDVNWRKVSDFYFASFKMNNTDVEVAYNEEGELLAVSRTIETTQLPLSVSMALDQQYKGYNISNKALELNLNGENYYYLTVNNDKRLLKLKCTASGSITVEQKVRIK